MLIAHFADTHLGKKLYGIQQTMDQFMNHFEQAVDLALREHVDAIVFAGDFFDGLYPPYVVLRRAIDIIDKIVEKSVRVYIVAGDHDRVKKSDLSPIHVLTKAHVPGRDHYFIDNVTKDGIEYCFIGHNNLNLRVSERLRAEYSDRLRSLSRNAGRNSIMILHQNILNFFPIEGYGLTLDDIPQNPKYIAMGHLHNRIMHRRNTKYGIQIIAYPGSIDVFSKDEIREAKTQGKGFYIVDLSRDEPVVQKVDVETTPFEYVESSIEESELKSKIIQALSNLSSLVRENNKGMLYLNLKIRSSDRVNLNIINDLINNLASRYLPSPDYIFKPKIERSLISEGGIKGETSSAFEELNETNMLTHLLMEKLGIEGKEARVLSEQIIKIKEVAMVGDEEGLLKLLDEISRASIWRKVGIDDNFINLENGQTMDAKGQTLESWFKKG